MTRCALRRGASWARLVAAHGAIELTIEAALYQSSVIGPGGGPFVPAAPRHFTIAPGG